MVHCKNLMAMSEIDSADIDQEQYLREVTRYFRALEKPLAHGPQIETLQDLISDLHREFESNYVNIEMVNHLLMVYKSNSQEWRKFAKFDRFKYTRNLVDAGNGKFNLMILCWGEGHASAIHDHADSHCFMKMLQGKLVETRYKMPNTEITDATTDESTSSIITECDNSETTDTLIEIKRSPFNLNDVAYINDHIGLHRVENPSHTETAVSLHLYCPPFNACSVFQSSGKKIKSPVTFYSKYGKRERQSSSTA